jgi:hypothetical protein
VRSPDDTHPQWLRSALRPASTPEVPCNPRIGCRPLTLPQGKLSRRCTIKGNSKRQLIGSAAKRHWPSLDPRSLSRLGRLSFFHP